MSYRGQRANTAYIHLPAPNQRWPFERVHIDPTVSMMAEVVACGKSTVNGNCCGLAYEDGARPKARSLGIPAEQLPTDGRHIIATTSNTSSRSTSVLQCCFGIQIPGCPNKPFCTHAYPTVMVISPSRAARDIRTRLLILDQAQSNDTEGRSKNAEI